ncbi:CG8366 [Drosophila busckii]|uniref:CG8366 n=2 Tax=Drosophila busckii TaxID=30019 RepID=A0A0M4EFW1_DROBS|nr:CG8366 [Drosophila busckii]
MDLEPGFRKADINNIPTVSSGMIFNYFAAGQTKEISAANNDLLIDYVHLMRKQDICEVKALVFAGSSFANTETHANVCVRIMEGEQSISEGLCSLCPTVAVCPHVVAFVFWLHQKSTDSNPKAVVEYWGHELEALVQPEPSRAIRIRDMLPVDETHAEAEAEAPGFTESEERVFLESVLEELAICGRDSALYRQCIETTDEFEALLVHHVLLKGSEYNVFDANSFMQHMELQAQGGLFESLHEVTKSQYKSKLWIETQYMRIRCSMMHLIATRKTALEDEQIFDMLFCKGRDEDTEERVQQKQHKRFILKQTEKLENKEYIKCGLLLHENYPYICGAPDGITDDHIVEIKSPKTEQDFEKYLEARETIAPKYMAQIQIQMFLANVNKALYCVLSPTFETSGALHYVWVQADPEFQASLLSMADEYWRDVVYPRLVSIYPQTI